MTDRRPFTLIAAVIFLTMAAAHLNRLASPFALIIGGTSVPQWVSAVALALTGGLAWMLLREARR